MTSHDVSISDMLDDVLPASKPEVLDLPEVVELITVDLVDPIPVAKAAKKATTKKSETILLHFVSDGLSAWGALWFQGQEVEIVKPSKHWDLTVDRNGDSWLDLLNDPNAQVAKWGKVMFAPGPWKGADWQDSTAKTAEVKRNRKPPIL